MPAHIPRWGEVGRRPPRRPPLVLSGVLVQSIEVVIHQRQKYYWLAGGARYSNMMLFILAIPLLSLVLFSVWVWEHRSDGPGTLIGMGALVAVLNYFAYVAVSVIYAAITSPWP